MKQIYSKHYSPTRLRQTMDDLMRKKLLMPIFAGLVFAAVVAGFTIVTTKNKDEIKGGEKSLVFQRQLIGKNKYVADVKGAIKVGLGTEKDGGRVTVYRGKSNLEFIIPISNPTLNSQDIGILQATDVSFASKDKIISARYSLVPNGIKEEIIMNKIPQQSTLPIKMKVENVKIKLNPDGLPVFYDTKGAYLFHFERPFAIDGGGNVSYGVRYKFLDGKNQNVDLFSNIYGKDATRRLAGNNTPLPDGQYMLVIEIDKDWLHDPKRVLPVTIDPTVVHNTSAEFSGGNFNRVIGDITDNKGAPAVELSTDGNTRGLYHFNETADNSCSGGEDACDATGTNHGTSTGSTISTTASPLGNSRSFDGNDTITLANETNFDFERTNNFSIEAWIKTSNPAFQTIVSKLSSTAPYPGYEFWIDDYGVLRVYLINDFGVNDINIRGSTPVNDGEWHHVAMTYSGSSTAAGIILYVDGVAETNGVYSDGLSASILNNVPVQIGSRNGDSYFFNGTIDEVQITNDVRSSFEIASDASRGPSIKSDYQELTTDSNTVGLWHMNESNATTTISDSSGNSNTATSTSSTNIGVGVFGSARTFAGTTYATTGSLAGFSTGNTKHTIEAWLKINAAATTRQWPLLLGGATTGNHHWLWDNTGTLYGGIWGVGSCGFQPSIGVWFHFATVYDGYTLGCYYNGKLVSSIQTNQFNFTATTLAIAQAQIAEANFNGSFDELRISNVARTAEEIKLDANRRPYGVYTSDVIDLTTVASWNSLTWTELGVTTGGGETPKNTTGLYAQWNFNESSGTSTNNDAEGSSCGGTPANCDGTLAAGFASTTSQDQAPLTGWTANNRKFGSGALMFDGSNDVVNIGAAKFDSLLNASIEVWFNYDGSFTTNQVIFNRYKDANNRMPLFVNTARKITWENIVGGSNRSISSDMAIDPGRWYHLVVECGGGGMKMYINGAVQKSTNSTTDCFSSISATTQTDIGASNGSAFFLGVIDSTRIYSRRLPDSEVLSNYNSSNVEVQTRVGADTSPDDGSWEAWRPTTNETQILSYDSSINIQPTDVSNLQIWLKADAIVGVSNGAQFGTWNDSSGNSNNFTQGTGSQQPTYQTNVLNGKPTVRFAAASSQTMTNSLDLSSSANTILYVVRKTDTAAGRMLAGLSNNWLMGFWGGGKRQAFFNGWITPSGGTPVESSWKIYSSVETGSYSSFWENGGNVVNASTGGIAGPNGLSLVGHNATSEFSDGDIAELIVYNRALNETERKQVENYLAEKYNLGLNGQSEYKTDSTVKIEGSAGAKISNTMQNDGSTAALFHLEETGGSGAYLKDSSGNANHGTPTGTSTVNGISGKGRSFGATDIITHPLTNVTPSAGSIEMWVKPTWNWNDSAAHGLWQNNNNTNVNQANWVSLFKWSNNQLFMRVVNPSATLQDCAVDATNFFRAGQWTHVAAAYSSAGTFVYVNGSLVCQSAAITPPNAALDTAGRIGFGHGNAFGGGTIDEVRISNAHRTSEEIAETYRMGKDHYINKSISSTDLSGKNSLSFYVAGDRPGTYLETTMGESSFANYQPDSNTVGLWHMDEDNVGNSTVLKFSTTNSTEANSYSYYQALSGGGAVVATGDYFEYDVYVGTNVANIGAIDIRYSDGTYARSQTWTDQNGTSCHVNGTTYYNKWFRRRCTVPAAMNGKTVSWIDFVNENDTATATNAYYDNFYLLNSAGGIKAVFYTQGSSSLNVLDFESNAANTQTLAPAYTFAENVYADEPIGGSFLKDATNKNNGTVNATFAQGKIGGGRSFNTDTDRMSTGTTSVLDTDVHTIDFWMKFNQTSDATYRKIFSYAPAGTDRSPSIWDNPTNHCLHWRYDPGNSGPTSCGGPAGENTYFVNNIWYHVAGVKNGGTFNFYVNGQLVESGSVAATKTAGSAPLVWGQLGYNAAFVTLDEFRISNSARSADDIRQAYEAGSRNHPITVDFAAKLDSGNLIANTSDFSFTVDATIYGLKNKGEKIFEGDKIIVRENYDGTEYVSQGDVTSVNASTGAITVDAWDGGATVPSGGFTVNASVFKWQREYWNITEPMDSHINATTQLTLRTTDGKEGRTVWIDDFSSAGDYLTNPAGSTITSTIDNRYFQYRMIEHSSDESVSASTSTVTLDYVLNSAPNTPTLDAPSDIQTNINLSATFQTTATDVDSDNIKYKIELCENLAMTTNCQTFDQTSSQTGWSGQNADGNTTYTSGTQALYMMQLPAILQPSTTYYWRTYAIDPNGSNTWGTTQSPPHSFTTTNPPGAPTTPYAEGATNPTGVTDTTPEFSGVHNDPDGDAAMFYQIQVNTQSDFLGTSMWDSGKTSMTSTANGVRSPDISYAGTAIPLNGAGTTYYWRIKFWDNRSAEGAYTTAQSFTMNIKPEIPTLDSPTNGATNQSVAPSLKTTATDNNSDNLKYKIELCTNSGMNQNCQTFDQTVSQTGWAGQNADTNTTYTSGTQATYNVQSSLLPGSVYYWRSYAIDPLGSNTWGATQASPNSFTTTTTDYPTQCRIEKAVDNKSLVIKWNDNSPNEINYEVQKSTDGGGFSLLQTLAANSNNYLDSAVSNGHSYQYRVAAIFNGSQYSQWCNSSTLTLGQGTLNFRGIDLK